MSDESKPQGQLLIDSDGGLNLQRKGISRQPASACRPRIEWFVRHVVQWVKGECSGAAREVRG